MIRGESKRKALFVEIVNMIINKNSMLDIDIPFVRRL